MLALITCARFTPDLQTMHAASSGMGRPSSYQVSKSRSSRAFRSARCDEGEAGEEEEEEEEEGEEEGEEEEEESPSSLLLFSSKSRSASCTGSQLVLFSLVSVSMNGSPSGGLTTTSLSADRSIAARTATL